MQTIHLAVLRCNTKHTSDPDAVVGGASPTELEVNLVQAMREMLHDADDAAGLIMAYEAGTLEDAVTYFETMADVNVHRCTITIN